MNRKFLQTIFIVSAVLLLTPLTLQAQIADIGSGPFTKCFIERTPKGAILKAKLQLHEGDEVLYFDNENNIRKYIRDFEYPDSRFLTVATYDKWGALRSIIFHISVPEGRSCYGAATVNYNEANKPLFDYLISYSEEDGIWHTEFGTEAPFLSITEELRVSDYIDTHNLKKNINLKEVAIPIGCKEVNFRRPQKGDMAMLNAVEAGRKVSVIDVETNESGGKRYKVEYNGKQEYFPDSALEDIEEIAKHTAYLSMP